jgi:hypothetical protein
MQALGQPAAASVSLGSSESRGSVSVLLGTSGGGLSPAVSFATGPAACSAATGDLNRYRRLDLVATSYRADSVTVLFGDEDLRADLAVVDTGQSLRSLLPADGAEACALFHIPRSNQPAMLAAAPLNLSVDHTPITDLPGSLTDGLDY